MYEIEIFNATEEQLEEIVVTLNTQNILCEIVDEDRFYIKHPTQLGEAVDAINALGFETDEDEYEVDELDF